MDREVFLARRKAGIGGSDVAAILGISPWRTPLDVYLDKTGRAVEVPPTEAMRLGTELEDYVARRYAEQTGATVLRHEEQMMVGHCTGNIDRYVASDPDDSIASARVGLECKTSSGNRIWDEVPVYYVTQVQHYMGLLPQIERFDVAVLFLSPRKEFRIYPVQRDDETIEKQTAYCNQWWEDHIIKDIPPEPSNTAECVRLYAKPQHEEKRLTLQGYSACVELKEIKTQIAALEKREDELKTAVMRELGEMDTGTYDGKQVVTWRSCLGRQVTNWEQVSADLFKRYPDAPKSEILEKFTNRQPSYRRFRV